MYPGRATCIRIRRTHVAGYKLVVMGYKVDRISRQHNYYSFMSRSTCIHLYPATDGRQTGDNLLPIQETCWQTDSGYKWIQHVAGQHVSWCKRGFSATTMLCLRISMESTTEIRCQLQLDAHGTKQSWMYNIQDGQKISWGIHRVPIKRCH